MDIKQEMDLLREKDNLDKEVKNSMLIAKTNQIANYTAAIQTVNVAPVRGDETTFLMK